MLLVFGAGLVVGIAAGVLIMALMFVARDADEEGGRLLEASE